MTTDGGKQESTYGFLSIVEIDQLGYCGGLLVLTSRGRPVEFHCTAPVAANRAQQILYGQTLKEFVCCDQIGVSLMQKVKLPPDVALVDEKCFLSLADLLQMPVAAVINDEATNDNDREHAAAAESHVGNVLEIDEQRFEVRGGECDEVERLISQFVHCLPAAEPFERIRLAISEAHAKAA